MAAAAATAAVRCDATVGSAGAPTLQHAINQTPSGGTIFFEARATPYACEDSGGAGASIVGKNLTLTTAPAAATAAAAAPAALAVLDCGGRGRALSMVGANVTL